MLLHSVKWNIKDEKKIKRTLEPCDHAKTLTLDISHFARHRYLVLALALNFSLQKRPRRKPRRRQSPLRHNKLDHEVKLFNYYSFQFSFARSFPHTSSTKHCGNIKMFVNFYRGKLCKNFFFLIISFERVQLFSRYLNILSPRNFPVKVYFLYFKI